MSRSARLHFILLGALLFTAANLAEPPTPPARPLIAAASADAADNEILLREAFAAEVDVTDKVVRERLVALGRGLGLAPAEDPDALEREARALGLQRSDPLIRRHLIDMMRLAAAGGSAMGEAPDEQSLRAAYDADPSRFAAPPRVSFTHVFLSRARRGPALASDAAAMLARLRADGSWNPVGDAFVRGARVHGASEPELARVFGAGFAAEVLRLAPGRWSGPLESPYGLHLVLVSEQLPAAAPPFDAIRGRLLHTYLRDGRARRLDDTLDSLRARYDVRIDSSAGADGAS